MNDTEKVIRNHATELSHNNADEIHDFTVCGCYFCLAEFKGKYIHEYVDDGKTVLCPYCGVDSVIPDSYSSTKLLNFNIMLIKEVCFDF